MENQGKTYPLVGLIGGIVVVGFGLFMMHSGIQAEGAIDIESLIFSGKIRTGSGGLLAILSGLLVIFFTRPEKISNKEGVLTVIMDSFSKQSSGTRILLAFVVLVIFFGVALLLSSSPESRNAVGILAVGTFLFFMFIAGFIALSKD